MGRKLIDVVCANCQNIFKKTESEFNRSEKNNKKHFCSIKCNKDYRKKNSFNLTKKCKFCGSEFIGDNIKRNKMNKRKTLKKIKSAIKPIYTCNIYSIVQLASGRYFVKKLIRN